MYNVWEPDVVAHSTVAQNFIACLSSRMLMKITNNFVMFAPHILSAP